MGVGPALYLLSRQEVMSLLRVARFQRLVGARLPGARVHRGMANIAQPHTPIVGEDKLFRKSMVADPTEPLSEHDEYMWPDAVSPEPALDGFKPGLQKFPHQALYTLIGVLSGIALFYQGIKYSIAPSREEQFRAVKSEFLYTPHELGGFVTGHE